MEHHFQPVESSFGSRCVFCKKLVGFSKQAATLRCSSCKIVIHKDCLEKSATELPCSGKATSVFSKMSDMKETFSVRLTAIKEQHTRLSASKGDAVQLGTENHDVSRQTGATKVEQVEPLPKEEDIWSPNDVYVVEDCLSEESAETPDGEEEVDVKDDNLEAGTTFIEGEGAATSKDDELHPLPNDDEIRRAEFESVERERVQSLEDEDVNEEGDSDSSAEDSISSAFPEDEKKPFSVQPFGSIKLRVLELAQVEMDSSTGKPSRRSLIQRASSLSISLGTESSTLYPLPEDENDGHVESGDAQSKKLVSALSSFKAQTSQRPGKWDFSKWFDFSIREMTDSVRILLSKSKFMAQPRPVGQILVPISSLLSSTGEEGVLESWFEFFPIQFLHASKFRPAAPTVHKSGMDFPVSSIGYARLRIEVSLNVKPGFSWTKYLSPLAGEEWSRTQLKANGRRQGGIKGSMESFKGIRRNLLRIRTARSFLGKQILSIPSNFLGFVRSWESPAVSFGFFFFLYILCFHVQLWQLPLLGFVLYILCTSMLLSGTRYQLNWRTVKQPSFSKAGEVAAHKSRGEALVRSDTEDLEGVSVSKTSEAFQEQAASGVARLGVEENNAGSSEPFAQMRGKTRDFFKQGFGKVVSKLNKVERPFGGSAGPSRGIMQPLPASQRNSQDLSMEEVQAVYLSRDVDNKFFQRGSSVLEADSFIIWNEHVRDKGKNLSLLEKSVSAGREIHWVERTTSLVADQVEKLISLLQSADRDASFVAELLLFAFCVSSSLLLFVYHAFPNFSRYVLLVFLYGFLSPPSIRSSIQRAIEGTTFEAWLESTTLRDSVGALWARIPTADEIGHREICMHQRVQEVTSSEPLSSEEDVPKRKDGSNRPAHARDSLRAKTNSIRQRFLGKK